MCGIAKSLRSFAYGLFYTHWYHHRCRTWVAVYRIGGKLFHHEDFTVRQYALRREQWIPRSRDEVFPFFADAANLASITPLWLGFRIVELPPHPLCVGAKILYRLRWGCFSMRWVTEITVWDPPARFEDVQRRGPYALWHHTHEFEARDDGTLMRDTVRYALPFGPLGTIAHRLRVQRDLEAIFDYRSEKIRERFGGDH